MLLSKPRTELLAQCQSPSKTGSRKRNHRHSKGKAEDRKNIVGAVASPEGQELRVPRVEVANDDCMLLGSKM